MRTIKVGSPSLNHVVDWDHPREVVSYKNTVIKSVDDANDLTSVGSFTTDVGDRLLIIFALDAEKSGWKLSSDMSSASTIPAAATMQCHVSAHWVQLGDDTNNLKIAYSVGFESKALAVWIDRATPANSRISLSTVDSDPLTLAEVTGDTLTTVGTDAGIGTQTFNMQLRGGTNRGPVRILKWAAGETVPSAAEIAAMLEWNWYRWSLFDHRIIYPPLKGY